MLKLTVTVLAVALAGTASAAGWRSLRVDASSEAAFEQSLAEFKDKLTPGRRYVFGKVLQDVWVAGTLAAEAEQRDFTAEEYYRQLDGLSYEQVVTLVDPSGEAARRYRAAYDPRATGDRRAVRVASSAPAPNWGSRPPNGWGMNSASFAQAQQQCRCAAPNGPQGN
jgi:hypothetical protein